MKKALFKAVAMILAAVSILGLCTGAFALQPDPPFSDIAQGSWYEKYCNAVSETGIMNGTGNGQFSPMTACNRAMFVTILYRLAGSPAVKAASTMTDVAAGSWYADAVAWAQESGVTTGYADGTFGVTDTLNRQQMVTFLHRFAKYMGKDVSKSADISSYADNASVQSWAKEAVSWAVGEGVIQGTAVGLEPDTACNRAMAATVISRMNGLVDEDVTRADLERGVVEVAWAYYNKGVKVQYCGRSFNEKFEKWYGGAHRPPVYSTIEDATSDYDLYTVCSDYVYSVYDNALNYPLLGGRMNYFTNSSWWGSGYPEDFAVLRWVSNTYNDGNGYNSNDKKYHLTTKLSTTEEALAFLKDYENTMRPGDVINLNGDSGHNMLYIGNGYILDSAGTSYNEASKADVREASGSISTLRTLQDYIIKENASYSIEKYEKRNESTLFCVLRPIDLLVIDDGDNDPSNDKLDTAYVMKETELTRFDPKVRTSGFTVTNSTRSRVKYPAMEIDRTVDCGLYGTTYENANLTYSVKISNCSNGESYTKWRSEYDGKAYTGDDYKGLVVKETVPAGTKLVSVSEGGVVNGNNITWTVDIARGQKVDLTYTVAVTAKQGETIVATGGWVDYIPSNTIETVVGGAKMPAAQTDALKAFAAQKPEVWNSNEGFKISAKSTGTAFANRIYGEVMGLDLQLPTVQEIFDNVFKLKHIQMDTGYTYRLNKPLDTYMYELNDDATGVYKTIRNMVINTYAGGQYVFTDRLSGETTINSFRTEYLDAGDIIIHGMLSPYSSTGAKRTVKETNVIVYLGDGTFATMNSNGEMYRKTDEVDIWQAFSYDFFVALRPTQAYADITKDVPAYDKSKSPALTEADANKALDPWSQEALKKAFAGINSTTWKQARSPVNQDNFTKWVYQVANLDIADKVPIKMSVTTSNGLFLRAADGTYSRQTNVPENAKDVNTMLLKDAYGGKATKGGDPKRLDASGDLLIGDIICMYTDDGKKHYYIALKVDDNKYFYSSGIGGAGGFTSGFDTFAEMHKTLADYDIYYVLRPSRCFGYGMEDVSAEPTAADTQTTQTATGGAPADAKMLTLDWDVFYVLRPSQAVSGLDMTKHVAKLKTLDVDAWRSGGRKANQRDFGKWVYNQLGVDLTDVLTQNISYTVGSSASKGVALFKIEDGKYVKTTGQVADLFAGEAKMYVDGMCGGANATGGDQTKVMNLENYKPGDLICLMQKTDSFSYGACVYLGDGKFLTVVNNSSSAFSTEGHVLTFEEMKTALS